MIRGIVRNPLIAGLPLEMSCREPSILRIDCSDSHDAPEGNGIPRPTPSMAHRRIVCHWQGESDRQENGYDARRDPHVRIGLSQETLETLGPVSQ